MNKGWLIGAAVIALTLGSVYTIPAHAQAVTVDISGQFDRRPSGYPDDQSAMPCCNITKKSEPEVAHYSIAGSMMSEDMQDFVHQTCVNLGVDWYFPYFICQIYQESRFNPNAVSSNGMDYGYCQLRITYHEHFKALVGHPEWDLVNDPFANVYVGCFLMAENLKACRGSVGDALARYYNSGDPYWNSKYVEDVLQWTAYLERIN